MLDLVGKKLGKYEIIAKIGQGGMAIVYKATDTTLQRTIALKVMLPHLTTDPGFVKRFQQEAITAANLKHPHIVTIYEVGEQKGAYYIAMEHLPGRTLRQIIKKRGMLSLERTVKLLDQIADALTYAHQQRLIHRDIKPSNILVDAEDNVTLTDFGIAKAAQYVTIVTAPGRLVGTPQYMSPEHAEGKELDHRSDIYALGVVLYEMLTGEVPFPGKTPTPVLYAHVHKKPPPPSRMNPKIPRSVERVVLKALAKRPETRYQSAVELAQGLRDSVERAAGVSKAALLPGVAEAILDFWKLRKLELLASGAVLLVLVGLSLGRGWLTRSVGKLAAIWSPAPTPTLTATPTPSSTMTPTATHTPLPSPTSTPTTEVLPTPTPVPPTPTSVPPTPTSVPPTPTPVPPTSTSVPPTSTPTPTEVVPTSTIAPTAGPSATATIPATPLPKTPIPSPTQVTRLPAPILIEPEPGKCLDSGRITLSWVWPNQLRQNDWFSVSVKAPDCALQPQPILRLTENHQHEIESDRGCNYRWQVVVIHEKEDGTSIEISEPSEEWSFWWVISCEPPPTPPPTKEPPSTEKPTPP